MSKTLCFYNLKGGCGKTASCAYVGGLMSNLFSKRVLLVDLDPQANLTSIFLESNENLENLFESFKYWNKDSEDDYEEYEEEEIDEEPTIRDLILDKKVQAKELIKHTEYPNLDILPSCIELSSVERELMGNATLVAQTILKKKLSKISSDYDYILIDCSPSLGLLNVNALGASDYAFVPMRSDGHSIHALEFVHDYITEIQEDVSSNLKFGFCFLTQFDGREKNAKFCRSKLISSFDGYTDIPIRKDTDVERISLPEDKRDPLPFDKPEKEQIKGAKDYVDLTKKIIEICEAD